MKWTTFQFATGAMLLCLVHAHAAESVKLSILAVEASNEGREAPLFGAGLERIKDALKDLPQKYDTFRRIKDADVNAEFGKETKTVLNSKYTLFVRPSEKDSQGRYKMAVRLEETVTVDGKEVKKDALKTAVLLSPGKPVILAGPKLKLEKGDLIVALFAA